MALVTLLERPWREIVGTPSPAQQVARTGDFKGGQNRGGRLPEFEGLLPALAARAMRRVFDHHCRRGRCPHLEPMERLALDIWLAPRLEALGSDLADALRRDALPPGRR